MKYNIKVIKHKRTIDSAIYFTGDSATVIINGVSTIVSGDPIAVEDGQTVTGAIWQHIFNSVIPGDNRRFSDCPYFFYKGKASKAIRDYFNSFYGLSEFVLDSVIIEKLYKAFVIEDKKREEKARRACKKKGIPYETTIIADRIILDTSPITSSTFKMKDIKHKPFNVIDVANKRMLVAKQLAEDDEMYKLIKKFPKVPLPPPMRKKK